MISDLKEKWRGFHQAGAGRRFRDANEQHRKSGLARKWWGRLLFWIAGLGLVLIGAFFSVAPGPASIFIFPGAILLACESQTVARLLDWLDVKLSPVMAYLGRTWRRLTPGAQLTVKIVTACGSIAGVIFGIMLMR